MLEGQIQSALEELQHKTLLQVQQETALTWAGRACAAAQMGLHDDAHEYAHEAIEHAALSGDDRILIDIRVAMGHYGVEF